MEKNVLNDLIRMIWQFLANYSSANSVCVNRLDQFCQPYLNIFQNIKKNKFHLLYTGTEIEKAREHFHSKY